ncbi:MAG: TIGR04053 family radical SAM/SPASM domain-containing protein [Acidobacteria bacterium]|nr:TIGR04053 family radical SAM/SPASM domain-containing protein [Acidobacteriota bacterium]
MDLDRVPVLVFWETTRACPLACKHCRASAIHEPLPGELSTEEGLRFVQDVAGFGERPPALILTGGDPLARRDLLVLAARARSLGIPIGFAPSVSPSLYDGRLARLKEMGVKTVSISLDGARAETHDGVRGIPGHFGETLEALRRLVSDGFTVQVNTTVMRDNVEELADVAALLAGIGVHIWEVFFLIHVGRGSEVLETTPAENEDVCHFLYDASQHGFIVRTVEAPFFRRVAAWRREEPGADPASRFGLGPLYRRLAARLCEHLGEPVERPRAQTMGTRDGKGIVFVGYNGDVYPAGFLPLTLGNVRDTGIVDIYRDHPTLRAIRSAAFSGRCGVCEFRDLCGGSRARAFAAFGDPLAEDPACGYVPAEAAAPAAGRSS